MSKSVMPSSSAACTTSRLRVGVQLHARGCWCPRPDDRDDETESPSRRNSTPRQYAVRGGRYFRTVPAHLTVLSGPSGVGKGSVVAVLRRLVPQMLGVGVVHHRAPRPGETDGIEYRFVDRDEFARLAAAGELIESDEHFGNWYGTPRKPVLEHLDAGVPTLLEIDLEGARQVRTSMPDTRFVFLAPPSLDELMQRLAGAAPSPRTRSWPGSSGPGPSSPPRTSSTRSSSTTTSSGPRARSPRSSSKAARSSAQISRRMSSTRSFASPKSIWVLSRKNSGFCTPA